LDSPAEKETPKLINLVPVGFVLIPVKVSLTVPVKAPPSISLTEEPDSK